MVTRPSQNTQSHSGVARVGGSAGSPIYTACRESEVLLAFTSRSTKREWAVGDKKSRRYIDCCVIVVTFIGIVFGWSVEGWIAMWGCLTVLTVLTPAVSWMSM